jgi:hypothetical protein
VKFMKDFKGGGGTSYKRMGTSDLKIKVQKPLQIVIFWNYITAGRMFQIE